MRAVSKALFSFVRFGTAKYSSLVATSIKSLYHRCITSVVKAYKERFSAFSQDIFKSMKWLNQANWDLAEKNYGINDLLFLADHFKDTLDESKFELDCLKSEWRSFKHMANQNYGSIKTPLSMWQEF